MMFLQYSVVGLLTYVSFTNCFLPVPTNLNRRICYKNGNLLRNHDDLWEISSSVELDGKYISNTDRRSKFRSEKSLIGNSYSSRSDITIDTFSFENLFDKVLNNDDKETNYMIIESNSNDPSKSKIRNIEVVAVEEEEEVTDNSKNEWIARMILLTVSAFYGTNFGCVKILNEALDPSFAAACRFSVAAFVFLPNVLKVIKDKPKLVMAGLEVGAYNAGGYYFSALSLSTTTSVSTVAFLASLAVVVVPIMGILFPTNNENEKNKQNIIDNNSLNLSDKGLNLSSPLVPALLAALGVGCLELGGTQIPGIGDLLALAQPLFFGIAFWRVEKCMHDYKEPGINCIFFFQFNCLPSQI